MAKLITNSNFVANISMFALIKNFLALLNILKTQILILNLEKRIEHFRKYKKN